MESSFVDPTFYLLRFTIQLYCNHHIEYWCKLFCVWWAAGMVSSIIIIVSLPFPWQETSQVLDKGVLVYVSTSSKITLQELSEVWSWQLAFELIRPPERITKAPLMLQNFKRGSCTCSQMALPSRDLQHASLCHEAMMLMWDGKQYVRICFCVDWWRERHVHTKQHLIGHNLNIILEPNVYVRLHHDKIKC
jgi:hypothetical protein